MRRPSKQHLNSTSQDKQWFRKTCLEFRCPKNRAFCYLTITVMFSRKEMFFPFLNIFLITHFNHSWKEIFRGCLVASGIGLRQHIFFFFFAFQNAFVSSSSQCGESRTHFTILLSCCKNKEFINMPI